MYQQLIASVADPKGLAGMLIQAIIEQESGGNPWAFRYEPAFFRRYLQDLNEGQLSGFVPRGIPTLATEKQARATSWGLMQIMGETARSIGFSGRYLTELLDPATNLEWGCLYLAQLLTKTGGNTRQALLRWNGGGDPTYPDKVLKRVELIQSRH